MDAYKIFKSLKFHTSLLLISTIFILLSIFKEIPNANNNYSLVYRNPIEYSFLLLGFFFLFLSLILYTLVSSKPEWFRALKTAKAILHSFDTLRPTQKAIIKALYKDLTMREISNDDLYLRTLKRVEKKECSSSSEHLYRCYKLESQGFFKLREIGNKTTIIVGISRVQIILLKNKRIDT